jgi:transposase
LSSRLGRSKAIVAIARRLLVAVWHILSKQEADRHAVPKDVARSFFNLAYKIGVRNLPDKHSALSYTRYQLDRLGVGNGIDSHPLGHALPQIAAFQPYPKAAVEVISM